MMTVAACLLSIEILQVPIPLRKFVFVLGQIKRSEGHLGRT